MSAAVAPVKAKTETPVAPPAQLRPPEETAAHRLPEGLPGRLPDAAAGPRPAEAAPAPDLGRMLSGAPADRPPTIGDVRDAAARLFATGAQGQGAADFGLAIDPARPLPATPVGALASRIPGQGPDQFELPKELPESGPAPLGPDGQATEARIDARLAGTGSFDPLGISSRVSSDDTQAVFDELGGLAQRSPAALVDRMARDGRLDRLAQGSVDQSPFGAGVDDGSRRAFFDQMAGVLDGERMADLARSYGGLKGPDAAANVDQIGQAAAQRADPEAKAEFDASLRATPASMGSEHARESLARSITRAGGSGTQADVDAVVGELRKMPITALRALADSGVDVVASRGSVTDMYPEMRDEKPRGYPRGETYEDVGGAYFDDKKTVVIATEGTNEADRHVPTTSEGRHGSANLTIHEAAHAIDANTDSDRNSKSKDFNAARDRDLPVIGDPLGGGSAYYGEPSEAGQKETYAESAARYYGEDGGGNYKIGFTWTALNDYWRDHPLGGG